MRDRVNYPESFFQEEVKKGFTISAMMKRCWASQMEVLRVIATICDRHGLKWYADGGTLIGAVREHGFIPWDDDIDITMKRCDWQVFQRVAQEELPKGFVLVNDRKGVLKDNIAAVVNSQDTVCLEKAFLDRFYGFPYAVGVDIFILDNVPDDEDEMDTWITMFSYAYAAGTEITGEMKYEDCSAKIKGWIDALENMTGRNVRDEGKLKNALLLLADHIAAMYYDAKTEYVTQLWTMAADREMKFEKRWYDDVVYAPFEYIQVPVPTGYHEILTKWYGDYMKDVRFEGGHDYPFYKKYEPELERLFAQRNQMIPECFQK